MIVDSGHRRARDLALKVPDSPLEAVMSAEVWDQVYRHLAELVGGHRTTLIFVNTRRMAERATRKLSELLGEEHVAAHHGSLAKGQRLDAEQRLKHGKLKALVATGSLELGIDIGDVDLVCQLGSPRSIATFLQRVGRSGHAVDGTPKGRLFPLSRDELVECAALLDSVRRGELDRLAIPEQPLDVLAQQIVAELAAREYGEDELYALMRRAWPYRNLAREDFAAIVEMLADGFSTRRGRRGALVHHDGVNRLLRGRRGARLTALTSGGTIPDNADYQVLLEPENHFVGTVNEDFAVESIAGQQELPDPAHRARNSARRRRTRHGTDDSVLARRSTGAQRRGSLNQCRNCAHRWPRCCSAILPGRRRCVGASTSARWIQPQPSSLLNISRPAMPRSAACRRRITSSWNDFSTKQAECS